MVLEDLSHRAAEELEPLVTLGRPLRGTARRSPRA